jgi:hypothetical protein
MLASVLHGFTKTVKAGLVSLVISMGEVESSHVHASVDQGFQSGNIPAGRTKSAENLGGALGRVALVEDHVEANVSSAKFRTHFEGYFC